MNCVHSLVSVNTFGKGTPAQELGRDYSGTISTVATMNAYNGANMENKSKNLQYSQSGSKSYVEIELGCSIMRSCKVKCHVSFHSYISNK